MLEGVRDLEIALFHCILDMNKPGWGYTKPVNIHATFNQQSHKERKQLKAEVLNGAETTSVVQTWKSLLCLEPSDRTAYNE